MRVIFRYEIAFKGKYIEIIKFLIEFGCDVNFVLEYFKIIFFYMVAEKWDFVVFELFIKVGVYVNVKDFKGFIFLFIVVLRLRISLEVVKVFVKVGVFVCDVNLNGRSFLYIIVLKNDDFSVFYLLEGGVNFNIFDNGGLIFFVIVVYENNIKIVFYLFIYGVDVNYMFRE